MNAPIEQAGMEDFINQLPRDVMYTLESGEDLKLESNQRRMYFTTPGNDEAADIFLPHPAKVGGQIFTGKVIATTAGTHGMLLKDHAGNSLMTSGKALIAVGDSYFAYSDGLSYFVTLKETTIT